MSIKQVKLSNQAKEQLIRLKTRTGVPHWNVLCRWAFCLVWPGSAAGPAGYSG